MSEDGARVQKVCEWVPYVWNAILNVAGSLSESRSARRIPCHLFSLTNEASDWQRRLSMCSSPPAWCHALPRVHPL